MSSKNTMAQTKLDVLDLNKISEILERIPNAETRLDALIEIEHYRDFHTAIAPLVWNTFGCVAALVQEIVMVYPHLNPPTLDGFQSSRASYVLSLLHGIAYHPQTRGAFIKANITVLLYPLMNNTIPSKPGQYLRLNSLGVIAALTNVDDPEVIAYLLSTDIFSTLIKIMETSNDLGRTVATYSFLRILSSSQGLSYVCGNYHRLSYTIVVLGKMVYSMSKSVYGDCNKKLIKHIIRCYIRIFEDNDHGKPLLQKCLPDQLSESVFAEFLADDPDSKHMLEQLLSHIRPNVDKSVTFQNHHRHAPIR